MSLQGFVVEKAYDLGTTFLKNALWVERDNKFERIL